MKVKGRVYVTCVRRCMMYGREAWAVSAKIERKLERTEMRMVRFMCGVRLREKCTNSEAEK